MTVMAKKKAASRKPTIKSKANKKHPSVKARSAFPGLAALKAAGATAVDVHFQGYGDDGCYTYGIVGGAPGMEITEAAKKEVEKLIDGKFAPYGEGLGSILLARLDLMKSVCHVHSGDGAHSERLAELVDALQSRGVETVVGDISSGKFSKCKVTPATAMSREEVCKLIDWLLHVVLDMARESDDAQEFEFWKGTLRVDVGKRRIAISRPRQSRSGVIQVDELDTTTFPIRLS